MSTPASTRRLTHEDMRCRPFLEGTVVRATGFCVHCDSWFRDAWVLKYRDAALPGGWAYCECWHLTAQGQLTPPRLRR
jgi:hypothetical protein